jgi:radical SAM protein with 4Fe4S-binding SPASM domain
MTQKETIDPAPVQPDERRLALGVGLTNECNLACAHCYRADGDARLTREQVLSAVEALHARAVNFGTGENGLHPEFAAIVEALCARGVAVTMTTNGLSASVLPDVTLAKLRDVEFSIDYPGEAEHDAARGPGNWALVEQQMARCRSLGVSTCVVTVLMSTNCRALPALAKLAAERGAMLRVNVYQAVRGNAYSLTFDQFWEAWRRLLAVSEIVTCGEPLLRAVLGLPRAPGAGCGARTVRLTPRGAVVPCVYSADDTLDIDTLRRLGEGIVDEPSFRKLRLVPAACRACPQVSTCAGGCASRRALRGDLERPDEFCPLVRGVDVHLPEARLAPADRELPKAASACTTIVRWTGPSPQSRPTS